MLVPLSPQKSQAGATKNIEIQREAHHETSPRDDAVDHLDGEAGPSI